MLLGIGIVIGLVFAILAAVTAAYAAYCSTNDCSELFEEFAETPAEGKGDELPEAEDENPEGEQGAVTEK